MTDLLYNCIADASILCKDKRQFSIKHLTHIDNFTRMNLKTFLIHCDQKCKSMVKAINITNERWERSGASIGSSNTGMFKTPSQALPQRLFWFSVYSKIRMQPSCTKCKVFPNEQIQINRKCVHLVLFEPQSVLSVLQLPLLPLQSFCCLLQHFFLRHSHGVLHLNLPHQSLQITLQLFNDAIRLMDTPADRVNTSSISVNININLLGEIHLEGPVLHTLLKSFEIK